MSPVLTTSLVPDERKGAYWRDALGQIPVPVSVVPYKEHSFRGRLVTDRIGGLRVATVEADAQQVRRTAAHIKRSPGDFVVVGVQTTGRTVLVQNGHEATAVTNDLFVYRTSSPSLMDHPEPFSLRMVYIPRRMLALTDDELNSVTSRVTATGRGCAAVLRPFILTVVASAHHYVPAASGGLANTLIDLFSTLVAEQVAEKGDGDGRTRNFLVGRVRAFIDQNLSDPTLSPESVAKAHNISVRYLHRLFEDEGITVSRLIQRRRLEECAHELARRSRTAPTVSAIAQRWGFVNPTHFSRAFRGAYGLSPREWRSLRLQAWREEAPAGVGAQ
ncbi:helix-turn-helix domain-containing protein [Streptomyces griseoviridis]|jgi:AraC-like DNA-binding protein|uniref:helix-turn-helix domain-containing protein n=1 Tax=Streptomyces griseoviridis TaxID=45398 RepID=UPI00167BBC53|nr:helix-turn-helix domain-containing protein [Streptomyces niveoruber]